MQWKEGGAHPSSFIHVCVCVYTCAHKKQTSSPNQSDCWHQLIPMSKRKHPGDGEVRREMGEGPVVHSSGGIKGIKMGRERRQTAPRLNTDTLHPFCFSFPTSHYSYEETEGFIASLILLPSNSHRLQRNKETGMGSWQGADLLGITAVLKERN